MKILEIVQELNPMLTDIDHKKRHSGLEKLVSQVIISDPQILIAKEIETITEFLMQRLTDHKSMVEPSLRCLSYFIDCKAKPSNYNQNLLEFLKSKVNIQRIEPKCRFIVCDIVEKILKERRSISSNIDSDLMYSIIHLIEGESYPENILRCFKLILYILKNFEDLEPFLDDIFDWLGCYFPIDYTPKNDSDQSSNIQRNDLVDAIYECFYCNPVNGGPVLSLLVATYEATSMVGKIEALQCLIKSYETFTLETLKEYTSTVWTSVRTQCLKRVTLVDPTMLELSYKLMSAMTKRLSEDDWLYKTFISDMYEELAIAFRKPEIELFEPAARLLVSAALPKTSGFNYIIDKILPVSIAALSSDDIRPIAGLTYVFEKLNEHHPDSCLNKDLDLIVDKLMGLLVKNMDKDQSVFRLILAIIRSKCTLEESTVDVLIDKLFTNISINPEVAEDCLLGVFVKGRHSIIFNDGQEEVISELDLNSLIKAIDHFQVTEISKMSTQFNLYLRHMIYSLNLLDRNSFNSLDKAHLGSFLISTRQLAIMYKHDDRILEKIGRLSGIIINKLESNSVQSFLMPVFTSDYCQKLVPNDEKSKELSKRVYLPIVRWFLKSLVIRNNTLYEPLMNLILNCMSHNSTDDELGLVCAKCFSFIQESSTSDGQFQYDKEHHYEIFPFYKQKFFNHVVKEVKIRFASEKKETKRHLLICSIAFQLANLNCQIYKRDIEWLTREILKSLNNLKIDDSTIRQSSKSVSLLLNSLEDSINKDVDGELSGLCKSMVDICLDFAKLDVDMNTRRLALRCLLKISVCLRESDLLLIRPSVIKGLKPCLADKKRLVRQFAGEARLRWTLIGQPVG